MYFVLIYCMVYYHSNKGFISIQATILDKIKWNSKPPSTQIKDEARRRAKTRHFPIIDFGGKGI